MLRYPLSTVGIARVIHRPLTPPLLAGIVPMVVALSMTACGEDGENWAGPLAGAPGATLPLPALPIIIEAEGGTIGADVQALPDAEDSSITYLTAGVNLTDAPLDRTDPRVMSVPVQFPAAGDYQMYVRARIGPNGGNDDSFFVDLGADAPTWTLVNGLTGFPVQGQPGYQEGSVIDDLRGTSPASVWMWVLIEGSVYTVTESARARTFVFSTREDGLDIDKFAFAAVGDGYTTGFTTDQLDAGERGVVVYPPVLPDPYEPPADQAPLAVGASKWLGMVCCGNQRPFLENYFNQVTPENGGKWGSVEGTRDVYNWAGVDEALAVAQANGFPFRFHVLLWGSQQPDWIATLPPEEQLAEIRQWFEAVNERYGDALTYIEVANEFVNQPPTAENQGNYVEALGGAGASGFDWVLNGFRMAREIFPPTAQLMLNEYSVLNNDELTGTYVALVQLLQAEGLIDAMGVQGHAFSTTGPVEQLVANINRLGATGLPLLITEMDIDGPEPRQLVDFQRLFPAFWENDTVAGITLWGYRPGMWRDPQQATLVYPNGAEKPALRWLKGYLRDTAPVVAGPATVTVASGYAEGTEVGTFVATDPAGAPYPAGAVTSWGVVPVLGAGAATDASQAVEFDEGTGRLRFEGVRLSPGTYSIRLYADVDMTVSNLFDVALTVQ